MKNGDKIHFNIAFSALGYNELIELFKAVREEIKRRELEVPASIQEK